MTIEPQAQILAQFLTYDRTLNTIVFSAIENVAESGPGLEKVIDNWQVIKITLTDDDDVSASFEMDFKLEVPDEVKQDLLRIATERAGTGASDDEGGSE